MLVDNTPIVWSKAGSVHVSPKLFLQIKSGLHSDNIPLPTVTQYWATLLSELSNLQFPAFITLLLTFYNSGWSQADLTVRGWTRRAPLELLSPAQDGPPQSPHLLLLLLLRHLLHHLRHLRRHSRWQPHVLSQQ